MRPCSRAFTLLAIPYRSRLGRHGMRSHTDLAMLPRSWGLMSSLFSFFWHYVDLPMWHMRSSSGDCPPWRGEREWFPVSNPALCWDVDVREDGRSRRLFRGPRRQYSLPLGSPIWGFTAHVGGRPPSRVHTWVSPHSLFFGCFSALRLHVSHWFVVKDSDREDKRRCDPRAWGPRACALC